MTPSSLSYGISTRMPRISPDQQLKFKDWIIPCGVRHSVGKRVLGDNFELSLVADRREHVYCASSPQ